MMPKNYQRFANDILVQRTLDNIGRASAAKLDAIQEVEYVKNEDKIVYFLERLQNISRPVIIICMRNGDVDDTYKN